MTVLSGDEGGEPMSPLCIFGVF